MRALGYFLKYLTALCGVVIVGLIFFMMAVNLIDWRPLVFGMVAGLFLGACEALGEYILDRCRPKS